MILSTRMVGPRVYEETDSARLAATATELGLVSRVTPVHTAVRNCTRDEGRPFEFGNRVLTSSGCDGANSSQALRCGPNALPLAGASRGCLLKRGESTPTLP